METSVAQRQNKAAVPAPVSQPQRQLPFQNARNSLLGNFVEQEKPGEIMGQKTVENTPLRQLLNAFSQVLDYKKPSHIHILYFKCQRLAVNIAYSSKDIGAFSSLLIHFQDELDFPDRAGIFLSALINAGTEKEYTISVNHIRRKINNLGFRSFKKITINGDVGTAAGMHMWDKAELIINGNAGYLAGSDMRGKARMEINRNAEDNAGESIGGHAVLIVNGNAGNFPGSHMSGNAKMVVTGNTGYDAGFQMTDNSSLTIHGSTGIELGGGMQGNPMIEVNGRISGLSNSLIEGSIFQGGRLLVKNGERTEEPLNKWYLWKQH